MRASFIADFADPAHACVVSAVGLRRESGDHTGNHVGEVVMLAGRVVDAVFSATCGATFKANQLIGQPVIFEKIDLALVDRRKELFPRHAGVSNRLMAPRAHSGPAS